MMAMTSAVVLRKPRNDDIRLKLSYYPYDVGKDFFFVPDAQRFISALRESKIIGPGKELFSAIYSSRSKQFLCSYQAQLYTLFVTYQVLAAISSCYGKIACPVKLVFCEKSQQPGVLIIRMRCYI